MTRNSLAFRAIQIFSHRLSSVKRKQGVAGPSLPRKCNPYKRYPLHTCSGVNPRKEIDEYLLHKEKRVEKRNERIRDFRVFDLNYIPEKPLMRNEVKPVVDALLRHQKTSIANNVLIVRTRGSGKTLSGRS